MAWAKLENPKPSANGGSVPPMAVKVTARDAPQRKGGDGPAKRYITLKIGAGLCTAARFHHKEHRCHVMLGSAADAGKLAISMDDSNGKFVAKKRSDGRYEITVTGYAAAGKFATIFPTFERPGSVQTPPGCPPIIVFEATAEFLAYK